MALKRRYARLMVYTSNIIIAVSKYLIIMDTFLFKFLVWKRNILFSPNTNKVIFRAIISQNALLP